MIDDWDKFEQAFCQQFGYENLLTAEAKGEPTPLKFYWPDTAVFLQRLNKIIRSVGELGSEPLYQLTSEAREADPEVVELWDATEVLHRYAPNLPELPEEIASVVANLPTEQFRRQVGMKGQ